jgi:enamine deaminase RidA (YjgF/YER057c/UK114 family)
MVLSEKTKIPKRMKIPSGTDLSQVFPYSRAIRAGNIIEVSGTGAYDEKGQLVGGNNLYEQAKCIYDIIEKTLIKAGVALTDVTKVTVYTTDISRWEEIARAHRLFFRGIEPAVTMVEVKALISPEMLVEIEVTAVDPNSRILGD